MADAHVQGEEGDLFAARLNALRDMVDASRGLAEQSRHELTSLLSAIIEVEELYPETLAAPLGLTNFLTSVDVDLGSLPEIATSGSDLRALNWARRVGSLFSSHLSLYSNEAGGWTELKDIERAVFLRGIRDHIERNDQRIAMAEELETYRSANERALERVVSAAEEAEGAAQVAKDAAGITGSATLSSFFENYAKSELLSARIFRALTMLAIAAAVALTAIFLPHTTGTPWQEVVYRLVIAGGLAGLAAYFGRQAGQHRLVYNWAKSIQVQLQSFPAFAESVGAEARDRAFDTFARRVLGPLPERVNAMNSEQPVTVAQAVDLATAVAKRVP
jgi:hypothetical protein